MRALVYQGPERLQLTDTAEPVARDGEVLVRVEAVGICGSDMHAYLGHDERRPAPLILGHEAAGTIVDGPGAGERVTINPLVTCGACAFCRDGRENLCPHRQILSMPPREGAFAELVAVPERNVVAVPDHVASAKACLVEPLACGWHAARLVERALVRPLADARCLVLGGGAIGLGAVLALEARGVVDIRLVEPHDERRARALTATGALGDDDAFEADVVVDAVGIEASRATAFRRVRPGGIIAHIGLGSATGGVDARRATLQEITFVGTYTYTAADFRDTAGALFDGRLGALDWFETAPLAEGPAAFAALRQGSVAAPKIVLEP